MKSEHQRNPPKLSFETHKTMSSEKEFTIYFAQRRLSFIAGPPGAAAERRRLPLPAKNSFAHKTNKKAPNQPHSRKRAERTTALAVYIMIAIFFPSHFSARAQMQTQS
jgi:hypothetical protein